MDIYNKMDFQHKGKLSSVVVTTLDSSVLETTAVLTRRQEWDTQVPADSAAPAVQGDMRSRHLPAAHGADPHNLTRTITVSKRCQRQMGF